MNRKLFHFTYTQISSSEMMRVAGFDEMERGPLAWCVFKLMNRHVGGGHFV